MSGGLRNACPRFNCRYPNRTDAAFCGRCGATLFPVGAATGLGRLSAAETHPAGREPQRPRTGLASGLTELGLAGFFVLVVLALAVARQVVDRVQVARLEQAFDAHRPPAPFVLPAPTPEPAGWLERQRVPCFTNWGETAPPPLVRIAEYEP